MEITKRTRSPRLVIAILLSVLLHILLIMFAWQAIVNMEFSSLPNGSAHLQIALVQNQKLAQKSTSAKPVQPDSSPAVNKKSISQKTTDRPDTKTAHKIMLREEPAEHEQAHQQTSSHVSNHMIKYLETEFRTRFQYPLLARKRGWQGKVIIALAINRAGYIHNVNVRQSSGYAVLDNNAVRTFEAIGDIIPALDKNNRDEYQLTIPVIYRLTRG